MPDPADDSFAEFPTRRRITKQEIGAFVGAGAVIIIGILALVLGHTVPKVDNIISHPLLKLSHSSLSPVAFYSYALCIIAPLYMGNLLAKRLKEDAARKLAEIDDLAANDRRAQQANTKGGSNV